jgi:SPP1 family predicted phage head-tail adaptor
MTGGAGALDQRVTLQARSEVADGVGGFVRSWADLPTGTVYAAVKARSWKEGFENGRVNAAYLAVFTIRNRADVNETCRLIWNGEIYNIRGILREGGRAQYLRIEAERGVAA